MHLDLADVDTSAKSKSKRKASGKGRKKKKRLKLRATDPLSVAHKYYLMTKLMPNLKKAFWKGRMEK